MPISGRSAVVVVGGGLVGCLAAISLARRGCQVLIYERGEDIRSTPEDTRRPAINLTLCTRGLRSLESAGALAFIQPLITPAFGRVVHPLMGAPKYQPYGEPGDAIYSVRRRELNQALLSLAEACGVVVRFGHACTGYDLVAARLNVATRGVVMGVAAGCVIGADGAFSKLRTSLHAAGHVEQSLDLSSVGYTTARVRLASAGLPEEGRVIHVWPRDRCMAIAFPNVDGSFSVAFHVPLDGPQSTAELRRSLDVGRFLETWFADLWPAIPDEQYSLFLERPKSMGTITCRPWSQEGRLLLLGDAAHAILPHYGQGANSGFEDCRLLGQLVDRHGHDWRTVFAAFERERRGDTEAIARLCYEHARDLHGGVESPDYDRRIGLERRLARLYPERIRPLYSMIAFSEMPYAEVWRRHEIQRQIVADLTAAPPADDERAEAVMAVVGERVLQLPPLQSDPSMDYVA